MTGKRPRRGQRILSARKAAQWDEERIRRFEEEQRRKREWIKCTEIAKWYSDLIGPAEPKTAAAARERAYQLLESDSLVGFFEEDGRFLHLGVSLTHWKMTAKRFQQAIENNLDNEQGRYYLRHCWLPKKLFRRWCARHELPESPQRFEPQESHPVPVAKAGDETAATKALASHESPQRFEPQESHPVPVAQAGDETAATKALASHELPQRFEPQESHPLPVAKAGDETAATKALASHESPQRFEPTDKGRQRAAATRQPQRERARRALRALFDSEVPDAATLPNKHLADTVIRWLKDKNQPPVGQRTIRRAAGRK
jgi:hypothetical protein